jgi:hypothetical protein
VKPVLLLLFGAALAFAQSATNTYMKDLNGNRADGQSFISTDGERTERFQSINGRQVPLEQTVDRVVRQDANGKVTERILRKFAPNGQLASTERVLIEENKLPGGGSSVRETTYRSDVNGGFQEAQRQTIETHVNGSTTTASTVIDRPTLNGSFDTVEKRSEVTVSSAANQRTTESVYRRDGAGGFQEALRYVKTSSTVNDTTTETSANYEPGVTGLLQLASQTDSTTTRRADGTETTQTNLYAHTVTGRLQENNAPMRVKEQQIVERRVNPDGSVVETLSVRRPSISDPNRLGELQKLSETVCKGKCQPEKPQPAEATKSAPESSRP